MATRAENVQALIDGWLAEELKLLAMTTDQRKLFTYSDGTRQYSWGEYMKAVTDRIKEYSGQLGQILSGPFEISSYPRC